MFQSVKTAAHTPVVAPFPRMRRPVVACETSVLSSSQFDAQRGAHSAVTTNDYPVGGWVYQIKSTVQQLANVLVLTACRDERLIVIERRDGPGKTPAHRVSCKGA